MNKLFHIMFLVVLGRFPLQAQTGGPGLPDRPLLNGGPSCIYWQAGNDRAFQFVFPVSLYWPVNDRLTLDLTTSPSANKIHTSNPAALNGLSDSRLSAAYVLGDDRFLLTCGLNLPTGKSALTWEELNAATVLAMQPLDFVLPVLGQGPACHAGLVMAQRLGQVVVGIGAGFLYRGAYQPYTGSETEYDPGEEISASVAIDLPAGRKNKLMLDLVYTSYSKDHAGGVSAYKAGDRLTLQLGVYVPAEYVDFQLEVRNRRQAGNQVRSEDLVPERLNSNGNKLDILSLATMDFSRKIKLFAVLEGKIYADNDYDYGGATIGGVGGGFMIKTSPRINVRLDGRVYTGSLDTGSEKVNLTGIRLLTRLEYRL